MHFIPFYLVDIMLLNNTWQLEKSCSLDSYGIPIQLLLFKISNLGLAIGQGTGYGSFVGIAQRTRHPDE